ncbi:MAG: Crp/Fnr family transcriptional regulator [Saprospiraceae bacterium]
MKEYELSRYFPQFTEKELRETLLEKCSLMSFEPNTVLMKAGEYVKVLPLVLEGSIKVIKEENDKEILMYYIQKGESCIMSISACIHNEKSQIKAITETSIVALLVPYDLVNSWLLKYSTWNAFVIASYKERFELMLTAFNAVAFQKMDTRLEYYLEQKAKATNNNELKVTHTQIANELATARVVVTRLLKNMENEGRISQRRGYITLLEV